MVICSLGTSANNHSELGIVVLSHLPQFFLLAPHFQDPYTGTVHHIPLITQKQIRKTLAAVIFTVIVGSHIALAIEAR